MNPLIERWIKATLVTSFTKLLAPAYLYLQGNDRDPNMPVDHFELRVDGPTIIEESGSYLLTFYINILICIQRQGNAYKIDDFKSTLRQAFLPSISAFQYGTDDLAYVGCLIRGDTLNVMDFDDPQAPSDVQYATMESPYRILISKG